MEENSMLKKRELGKTGFNISELGFGCGGFWGMKVFSERDAEELVHTAIEKGINFFDTGSNYSQGNAEIRLGNILKNVNKDNLLIGTKAGTRMLSNGKFIKDFTEKGITESVHSSLEKLKLDYIPLLQLHSPTPDQIDESLETLFKLKKAGLIKHAGVSSDGDSIRKVASLDFFDAAMLTYNVIHKEEPAKIIDDLYDKEIGILIKSPMAHSLYSNDIFKIRKLSDVWYFLRVLRNYRYDLAEGRKYRFINDIPDWKGSEVALKYVLSNEKVSCSVIGTTKTKHLVENIGASNKTLPTNWLDQINSI